MIRKKSKIINFEKLRKEVIIKKLAREYEISDKLVEESFGEFIAVNDNMSYSELSRYFHTVLIQKEQRGEW